MARTPNREEVRALGCGRHNPPLPLVKITSTIPDASGHWQETRIDWIEPVEENRLLSGIPGILCNGCHQFPLLVDIPTDRNDKRKVNIFSHVNAKRKE